MQHEPADPGDGVRAERAATPGRHEGQSVHGRRGSIADRPLCLGHAQLPHDPALQERAEVRVFPVLEARRDAVPQHRHAGVAVAKPGAGLVEHGGQVPGDRERIERRRHPLPEIPLPAGQAIVRLAVRLGILDPRGVRRQVPDGDGSTLGVVSPLWDEFTGRVVGLDPTIGHRDDRAHPAHERLRHRGGAVRLRPPLPLGVPLEHDPIVADDEEVGGLTVLQRGPGRFERRGAHPPALGSRRGPFPGRRLGGPHVGRRHEPEAGEQDRPMPSSVAHHRPPCPGPLNESG